MLFLVLFVVAAVAYFVYSKKAAMKEDTGLTTVDLTKKDSVYASSSLAGHRNARTSASAATAKPRLGQTESKTKDMIEDMLTETPPVSN